MKPLKWHFLQSYILYENVFRAKCGCCAYHRVTFSNNTDFVCFQFNWLLLMGTLLQETSDFNSTTKRKQPLNNSNNNNKLSDIMGLPLHLHWHGEGLCTRINRNAYGSFRSELAIICKDCKELPSFTWRKIFFFWDRTERTHPYNKRKYREKEIFEDIRLHTVLQKQTKQFFLTWTFILAPNLEPESASDILNLVGVFLQ